MCCACVCVVCLSYNFVVWCVWGVSVCGVCMCFLCGVFVLCVCLWSVFWVCKWVCVLCVVYMNVYMLGVMCFRE